MNRNTLSLGRILGIPIGLDYSWFLIFALLTWALATGYYPNEFTGQPTQYWILGAATVILLFASVVLHELGHSVVARRYKVSVHSITLFVFGGVARIETALPSAKAEFWIALAGPVVSFILAIFFGMLESLAGALAPLLALFKYLAYVNGTLALFNLIPGFPLDGGRIFRAFVWAITHNLRRATLIAASLGRFIAYSLIFLGVWQMFTGNFVNGLWIAFIGWFLESAAVSEVRQQTFQDLIAGHQVAAAMRRDYTVVDSGDTLEQLVNEHILGAGRRSLIVAQNDQVMGLLTLRDLKEIPRTDWAATTAAQAMIPVERMRRIQPDTELKDALREMDRDGVNQLPVMVGDQLQGVLGRDDVISLLRTIAEFNRQ